MDDGSTDNSLEIARAFDFKNVKICQQKNEGAAVARNRGFGEASGKYIQFMDADDFLSRDKIEKQVLALEGYQNRIAVCNYVSFNEDSEINIDLNCPDQSAFIKSSNDPADFLINLWGGNGQSNFIQTNCWLIPRSVITKAGGWRNYRCPDDDGEFFARVLLASEGIIYVPEVMNFYRRINTINKLSANSSSKYIHNVLLTIDLKYSYLKAATNNKGIDYAIAKQYLDFAVHQFPQHKIFSKIAYKRFKQLKQDVDLPVLGGKIIELIKSILGWKLARIIKHTFRS